jgi:hypothetical protein
MAKGVCLSDSESDASGYESQNQNDTDQTENASSAAAAFSADVGLLTAAGTSAYIASQGEKEGGTNDFPDVDDIFGYESRGPSRGGVSSRGSSSGSSSSSSRPTSVDDMSRPDNAVGTTGMRTTSSTSRGHHAHAHRNAQPGPAGGTPARPRRTGTYRRIDTLYYIYYIIYIYIYAYIATLLKTHAMPSHDCPCFVPMANLCS